MGFDVRADVCADCLTISVENALTAFVALEAGRQYVVACSSFEPLCWMLLKHQYLV